MNKSIFNKDTVVIIPVFNEESSIGKVLQELPRERLKSIVVVNNGSTDQTKEVALSHGALVIDEPRRGYGQACLTGIHLALDFQPENIIFLDGDYSDFPTDIEKIYEGLDQGHQLVIGSRLRGLAQKGSIPFVARFGNTLTTELMKLLFPKTPLNFTDLGPFRGIKASTLRSFNMQDTNFGWTIEMQLKAMTFQTPTTEVSVRYRKRIGKSKISGTFQGVMKAGSKILFTLFWWRLKTLFTPLKKVATGHSPV